MDFENHPGPLLAGDLIVLEVYGKIVPKRPTDPSPQWFVVLEDQVGKQPVPLKPFIGMTGKHKVRKYACGWAP